MSSVDKYILPKDDMEKYQPEVSRMDGSFVCFEADCLSLDKAEHGRWRSYGIELSLLPSIPAEKLDQDYVSFLAENIFPRRPDVVLTSFTKLENGKFKFTSEATLEIIVAARQLGLTHIRSYCVDLPLTVADVYKELWEKMIRQDLFTTEFDLTTQCD